jgi:hypothetical protein
MNFCVYSDRISRKFVWQIFCMRQFVLFVSFHMSHNGLQRIHFLKNYICLAWCKNDIHMCSQYTVPPFIHMVYLWWWYITYVHIILYITNSNIILYQNVATHVYEASCHLMPANRIQVPTGMFRPPKLADFGVSFALQWPWMLLLFVSALVFWCNDNIKVN